MVMKVECYRLWSSTTHRAGVPGVPQSSVQTELIMKEAALWPGTSAMTWPSSWGGGGGFLACRRCALRKGLCSQVKQLWEEVSRQCRNSGGEKGTEQFFFKSLNP